VPRLEGRSLLPALRGDAKGPRTLNWEHEGNRAIRQDNWKLVASFRGEWELYDMASDRSELQNLASTHPSKLKEMAEQWQKWADRVQVVPWEKLPGGNYKPTTNYRKKSEPIGP
jgi:arylsulfatase